MLWHLSFSYTIYGKAALKVQKKTVLSKREVCYVGDLEWKSDG